MHAARDRDDYRPPCVGCGGVAARKLYDVRGFPIVACTACGLARTELPPSFDPDAIYTEEYFQGGQHDGYADYAGSGDDLRREFRRTLDTLPVKSGKLVEIGCAYGFFLDEARGRFAACGVEVSDAARAACVDRGHHVARDLAGVRDRGPFDVAVMLDVIEHLARPDEVLAELRDALRPGAPLVITTGDFGSPLARVMGRRWRLMTPPQHVWFFSKRTIAGLLARHGFEIADVTHPWKWVPTALIAYQATRYLGGQKLVTRFPPPGRVPLNLFDAMRVVAIRA
jgi:SAM-dependent methyltransferase